MESKEASSAQQRIYNRYAVRRERKRILLRRLLTPVILAAVCVAAFYVHTQTLDVQTLSALPDAEKYFAELVNTEEKPPETEDEKLKAILENKNIRVKEDWNLILINAQNKLPDDFSVELTEIENGQAVDSRIAQELQNMLNACRKEGLSPLICSAYRTPEKQQKLYDNKRERLIADGFTRYGVDTEAAREVALPGRSEHQSGLAVDMVDTTNQNLNETQESTAVQQWLMEHSWEYGFVLRYPNNKREITGIIYEPWHYRYVGKEAARQMKEQGLCLEEFLSIRKELLWEPLSF